MTNKGFKHLCAGGLFTISTDLDGCKTCGMSRLKYESLMDEAREKRRSFTETDIRGGGYEEQR